MCYNLKLQFIFFLIDSNIALAVTEHRGNKGKKNVTYKHKDITFSDLKCGVHRHSIISKSTC